MASRRLRRLLILLSVVLVLLGVFAYLSYDIILISTGLPVGTGPAGPYVPVGPFSSIWSERRIVLLGLGDSVTRGLGAPEGRTYFDLLQHNDDEAYPDMCGKDIEHVLPNTEAVNIARNYSTSEQHLTEQLGALSPFDKGVFGIVVITSGGNDIIHDYGNSPPRDGAMYGCTIEQAQPWCANLKQRLQEILSQARAKFPGGCVVFLANVYDPTDGRGLPRFLGFEKGLGFAPWPDAVKVLDIVNNDISKICSADDNVYLVDVHTVMLGHGIYCRNRFARCYQKDDPTFWYYHNLEDPNPRGYDAIRRAFLLEIADKVPSRLAH